LKGTFVSSRRKAREAVLKALYLCESRGLKVDESFQEMAAVDREMEIHAGEPDVESLKPFALGLDTEEYAFALQLAHHIERKREDLNGLIRPVLKNWDLERISRIDRIILWIAVAELQFVLDVPPVVAVNEAIELSRTFSSHKSPSFINGVLDAIARNLGLNLKVK
jgi:transcription antitermination protein NusB